MTKKNARVNAGTYSQLQKKADRTSASQSS